MARKTSRKDVGAWLGGNRGTVQSRMPSVGASSDTEAKADVGGGQMEQVRAELGLGAYAFGVGAAGAIGGGVAAVRSGAAARGINKLRGEVVLVHGSPTQGIKTINPTKGANRNKGTRGVDLGLQGFFGTPSKNPQFGPSQVATKYALGDQEKNIAQNVVGQGSVYLAKAKKADLIFEQGGMVARTGKPVRVVKELKLSDYPREQKGSLIDDYVAALRRAGGPTVSRTVRKQSRGGGKNKR